MLSRTALHAVRALAHLAELGESEYLGAAAIAKRIEAPPNYLGKLLNKLAAHGIVEPRKGAGGGFRLARPGNTISLYEAVEPIDRVSRWNGCFLENPVCGHQGGCAIHRRWGPVRDAYLRLLHESTVNEVASNGHPFALSREGSS
jgi:Rrf2 family protein